MASKPKSELLYKIQDAVYEVKASHPNVTLIEIEVMVTSGLFRATGKEHHIIIQEDHNGN